MTVTQTAYPCHQPPLGGNRIAVRLLAWGLTEADVETAIDRATIGPGRVEWQFAEVDCTTAARCPLNLDDPKTIAAGQDASGTHAWAYAVYRAQVAP